MRTRIFQCLGVVIVFLALQGCGSGKGYPDAELREAIEIAVDSAPYPNGTTLPNDWQITSAQQAPHHKDVPVAAIRIAEEMWCVVIEPPVLVVSGETRYEDSFFMVLHDGDEWKGYGSYLGPLAEKHSEEAGCTNFPN